MVQPIERKKDEARITNAMPGRHGGNLDDHLHAIGTKIYFPVRQRGGEITIRFDLLKGKRGEWPVSETEESWIAHSAPVEYPEAMREACQEVAQLLAGEWGMSMEDAFVLHGVRVMWELPRLASLLPSPA